MTTQDDDYKSKLTPEQYRVCRQKGTEAPFTGEYYNTKTPGVYRCACCGDKLFTSDSKYDSGSGWPSFFEPIDKAAVVEHVDKSHFMVRVEIACAKCGSHLGHVFDDGPEPTGLRYCTNSASLKLEPKEEAD